MTTEKIHSYHQWGRFGFGQKAYGQQMADRRAKRKRRNHVSAGVMETKEPAYPYRIPVWNVNASVERLPSRSHCYHRPRNFKQLWLRLNRIPYMVQKSSSDRIGTFLHRKTFSLSEKYRTVFTTQKVESNAHLIAWPELQDVTPYPRCSWYPEVTAFRVAFLTATLQIHTIRTTRTLHSLPRLWFGVTGCTWKVI